jgi:hypothetical protein
MTPAISEARWQEAQRCEAAWWANEARNSDKLFRDIAGGHHFTAGVLGIRRGMIFDADVLDIAGGPYPIGVGEPLGRYAVLDPAHYDDDGIERIHERAEGWRGGRFDEVWGYNVLQHVVDPAEVMATARACAEKRIRWFDVVETPIYPVHPHSIKADWLRAELSRDGFRIVQDIDGSRLVEGARQKWVALIAERT